MKSTYDAKVDAAYIYFGDKTEAGGSKKQVEVMPNVIIDIDAQGRLLGIEILGASTMLRPEFFNDKNAENPVKEKL